MDPRCGLNVVPETEIPAPWHELNPTVHAAVKHVTDWATHAHVTGCILLETFLRQAMSVWRVPTNIRSLIVSFLTLWLWHRYKRTDIHRGCFHLDMKQYFNWLYLDEWLDDEACTEVDCHLLMERDVGVEHRPTRSAPEMLIQPLPEGSRELWSQVLQWQRDLQPAHPWVPLWSARRPVHSKEQTVLYHYSSISPPGLIVHDKGNLCLKSGCGFSFVHSLLLHS
jgi:hypothetical protein